VPTAVTQSLAISMNLTAGSGTLGFATGNNLVNNLDFTGFTGIISNAGTSAAARFNVYGNITMGTGMTCYAAVNEGTSWQLLGTTTQTIQSNGVAFDTSFTFAGADVQLSDAFTTGSTRSLTLSVGSFISNGRSITCGTFGWNTGSTKTLNLANSTVTILGGTSATGFLGSTTGTTYNLTNTEIVFTTSGTAAFSGTESYGIDATVTMSGTGVLIIGAASQATRLGTLRNTVQPCTISLLSTTLTLTVTNFDVNGTAGNLVTLNSSVAGTAKTISKSTCRIYLTRNLFTIPTNITLYAVHPPCI
jgi:hypothetical protein